MPKVIVACAMVICLLYLSHSSSADEQLTAGSSSKQLRQQTVNAIPFHQLNAQTRDKISGILEKPSMYRRLPVTSINADPDHFRFLIRYPEVIVNIWQLMGVTKMETERTGPYTINTDDGAGTISSLELVYGTDDFHIFYGTGSYEGPVLKRKLSGECVLVVQSKNQKGRDGKPVQTSQLDVFLKVNNATAGLIARTIQPLVGSTADHNFVESLKFVQRLNETTEKNGPGVQQMSKKLDLDPKVRQQYNDVVDLVFRRAINNAAPEPRQSLNPQPARNLNSNNYTNPNLFDPGQRTYQSQSRAPTGQYSVPIQRAPQQMQPNQNSTSQQLQVPRNLNSLVPAHGHQPPVYNASGYAYQQNGTPIPNPAYNAQYRSYSNTASQMQQNQRAIQAQYQNYGGNGQSTTPNQVQNAGGWRGR